MYNRIVLIGRLTADPELRYTQNGVAFTRFTLAVNRDINGETDFINVVVWKKVAENCAKYLRKGSLVCAEGSLRINRFENQEGQLVQRAEVVANHVRFLEYKREQDNGEDPFHFDEQIDLKDEDLPF